jgi:2-methylisocitrate lyase-like PEP mutase family enzyme
MYELGHAVDRIRAAAEVARGFPFRFTLTARAENYVVGRPDLSDHHATAELPSGRRGRPLRTRPYYEG